MKNFLFGLIIGGLLVFGYFFIKENPDNYYIIKAKNILNINSNSDIADEPIACYLLYNPVCGIDGITYENDCFAEVANTEIAYFGECGEEGFIEDGDNISDKLTDEIGFDDTNKFIEPNLEKINGKLNEKIFCTPEQKIAEICTMEYMPVCGSDGQTYGNKCVACSQGLDYYIQGECKETKQECPQYMPPSPDFCPDGVIVDRGLDENGCQLTPICEKTE